MRFGKKGKLSPSDIGPYQIAWRFGQVAYELEPPQELSTIHPVFHVSMLRKCMGDPSHLLLLKIYKLLRILPMNKYLLLSFHKLRKKEIASVKVLWRNQQVEEITWEAEEAMKSKYPHLFKYEEKVQDAELEQ